MAPHNASSCNISDKKPSPSSAADDSNHQQQPLCQNYFAIGSMMNPISVKNRNLNLEENTPAMPAQLLDHKLVFFGSLGFAEAVPCQGATLHGVVYRQVPPAYMKELDNVEKGYIREKAMARLYPPNSNPEDPNSFLGDVTVYSRPADVERGPHIDNPPSERYLRIMIDGCRHHGVDSSYVKGLEEHEYTPRPSPKEYISFPVKEGAMSKKMTRQEVRDKGSGKDGNPLYICSHGRVIQFDEDRESDSFQYFVNAVSRYGQDLELYMGLLAYDPKYGVPRAIEEVSSEESAYREHTFCAFVKGLKLLEKWQVIAKLAN